MHPLYQANKVLFERYIEMLKAQSPGDPGDQTSPGHLIRLCEEAIAKPELPFDKASRWLGFVQGVMTAKGLITVEEEREFSRPLFHRVYEAEGILAPAPIKV